MGIDTKYGRVTLEHSNIGEDEPVIVFRAQDTLVPSLLKIYSLLCEIVGSPRHHLDLIHESRRRFENWQNENPSKVPDSNWYMEHRREWENTQDGK